MAFSAATRPVVHTRIGRITALVGCRSAHPDSLAKDLSEGRLELTAGLLEIAHDGGARVILEGPVSYTAESGEVGTLRYGKLTARAGKIGPDGKIGPQHRAKAGGQSADRPAPGPHHPAFVIRTPGVVATNLVLVNGGAEFGVAVEPAAAYGTTAVHVFRGRVVFEAPEVGSRGRAALSDGQFARLAVSVNPKTQVIEEAIRRGGVPMVAFVRQLPMAPSSYSVAQAAAVAPGTPIYAGGTEAGDSLRLKAITQPTKPNS